MRQYVTDAYKSVMNEKYNPLRHIQDENVRHATMLGLMWMWCVIFAVWTGAMFTLGASMFFHGLVLFGVLATVGTFEVAKRTGTKDKKDDFIPRDF
tara:strand:- start:117 stop:404 length:288 start_codon:yes stop_codon:yes gene_type:complete